MDKDVERLGKEISVYILQILITVVCFIGYGYSCMEVFCNAYPVASRYIRVITVFVMTVYICIVRRHNRSKYGDSHTSRFNSRGIFLLFTKLNHFRF